MPFRFLRFYTIPLLLSITASVVVVALNVVREPTEILLIFAGSLVGTLILEIDYILHAYFIEPEAPQSGLIKDYIYHRDFYGFAGYVQSHKDEITHKTLNSALFQVILALTTIFVLSSSASTFIKIMILSTFLNSIYRLMEAYLRDEAADWFWSLRINTNPQSIYLYFLTLVATLFYCFYIF